MIIWWNTRVLGAAGSCDYPLENEVLSGVTYASGTKVGTYIYVPGLTLEQFLALKDL